MVRKKKLEPTEAAKVREAKRNAVYTTRGTAEESAEMNEIFQSLDNTVTKYNDDLSNYIAQSEHYLNQPETIKGKSNAVNTMYQQRMAMMCIMPLARGLNVDSIISCVGMYAGICLIDKDFKGNIKKNVGAALAPMVDNFAQKADAKYPPGHPLKNMADKAQAWRDNYIKEQNGGRMPFTPQSAAIQDLAIHKMAFVAMRQPDADIEKIKRQHTEARERLFELAERDGVSKDDICKQVRIMVGKTCMQEESAMGFDEHDMTMGGRMNMSSGIFAEMNSGGDDCDVHRNDFHTEDVLEYDDDGTPHMHERTVWSGEFTKADGESYEPYNGDFTPREPDSEEQITQNIMSTIDDAAFMANDGRAFYNNMAAIYHSANGNPKIAMQYGTRGADDVDNASAQIAASEMFKVYRNAEQDGVVREDLSDFTSAYWHKTIKDTLKSNPDWITDWKECMREDKARQAAERRAGQPKNKYDYRSPVQGYDFNAEDKSNGRAAEYEASHYSILYADAVNGAQFSI